MKKIIKVLMLVFATSLCTLYIDKQYEINITSDSEKDFPYSDIIAANSFCVEEKFTDTIKTMNIPIGNYALEFENIIVKYNFRQNTQKGTPFYEGIVKYDGDDWIYRITSDSTKRKVIIYIYDNNIMLIDGNEFVGYTSKVYFDFINEIEEFLNRYRNLEMDNRLH